MDNYLENDKGDIVHRGTIPKDLWGLLLYAAMWDFEKVREIKTKIDNEGKKLVAYYPGVSGKMEISKMEYIGGIMDGCLFLK